MRRSSLSSSALPRASEHPPPRARDAAAGVASVRSAEALLRLALVEAVVAEDCPPLPETLSFDAERLAAARSAIQRCRVTAAALLLLPQLQGRERAGADAEEAAKTLQRRMGSLLPATHVASAEAARATAAAELARSSGCSTSTAERLLARLLTGAARTALDGALAKALRSHLILGGTAGAAKAAAAMGRAGAAALAGEVAVVGAALARLAEVQWLVHGAATYTPMAAALLE